jgi:hypothetical protein
MKHINSFGVFENQNSLTPEQIRILHTFTSGKWKINATTGLVDVDGDFDCSNSGFVGTLPVKFGKVSGNFNISANRFTSLDGCPIEVGGEFDCSRTSIASLKGSPKKVGGGFYCSYNPTLISLEGAPRKVGGYFNCAKTRLTDLKGAPEEVEGSFRCSSCGLKSLEGSPKEVGGNFSCSDNLIKNLVGSPNEVGGYFDCTGNHLLESFEGAPRKVGDYFRSQGVFIRGEHWNIIGWFLFAIKSREELKRMFSPLIDPKDINQELKKNPEKTIMKLKGVWKDPDFAEIKKEIKIPDRYKEEMEALVDLDALGF